MRKAVIISLLVVILAVLNYGVYEKELIRRNGEVVLLELRPVDPRSLLQGDYMRLRYEIERGDHVKDMDAKSKQTQMVIEPDENNIARFVRFYDGGELSDKEKLISFKLRYRSIYIKPDTFLFQEGHAKLYEQAKYGIFKFNGKSDKLLVGLADKDRNQIIADTSSTVAEE